MSDKSEYLKTIREDKILKNHPESKRKLNKERIKEIVTLSLNDLKEIQEDLEEVLEALDDEYSKR